MHRSSFEVSRAARRAPALVLLVLLVATSGAVAAEYECLIQPHQLVKVSSPVPGILGAVNVDRGDAVRKSQVLARLESGQERAAYALAKARAEFNERKVSRNEELYRKKLISIHEKDEIETETRLSQLEFQEASERLKLRTIHSPIAGVVVDRLHSPGEFVRDAEILQIAQVDPLNVEVIVPVEDFRGIALGGRATVRPISPIGGEYAAEVVVVDPVVDAASGTIGVRLELPNPKQQLLAGIKCRVEFPATSPVAAPPPPAP